MLLPPNSLLFQVTMTPLLPGHTTVTRAHSLTPQMIRMNLQRRDKTPLEDQIS